MKTQSTKKVLIMLLFLCYTLYFSSITSFAETIPEAEVQAQVDSHASQNVSGYSDDSKNENSAYSAHQTVNNGQTPAQQSMPAYSNMEIGGGKITGTESENGKSHDFAMYNSEQYMAPTKGAYEMASSVDGTQWYKQYAQDEVERKPYQSEEGKVAYHESIVQKLQFLYKYGPAIVFLFNTGLRSGELLALSKSKTIKFSGRNAIRIDKTLSRVKNQDADAKSKTKLILTKPKYPNSNRTIPLNREAEFCWSLMKNLYDENIFNDDLLLASESG